MQEWSISRLPIREGTHRNMHTCGDKEPESGAEGTDDARAIDIVASCREDIRSLWADGAVGVVLKKRELSV